jgi:hypothetical protein
VAQQGSGPPWPSRVPTPGDPGYPAPRHAAASQPEPEAEEYPEWAIPAAPRAARAPHTPRAPRAPQRPVAGDRDTARPGHRAPHTPPSHEQPRGRGRGRDRGRAQATRARRARHRVRVLGGGAAAAVLIAVLVIVLLPGSKPPSTAGANGFVTTYQPGEFRSVPNACASVPTATLTQYLPGKLSVVGLPSLTGNSGSQCNWTLDAKPVYRLLEVTTTAYAPSGLASGNGSATAAATDAYAQQVQAELHPPRDSHQPAAQVTTIRGLGAQGFSAFQAITAGGLTTYRVTVVTRFRNVLITVEFSGLDHASHGGYGPVSTSLLQAGAAAAARDVLAKLS